MSHQQLCGSAASLSPVQAAQTLITPAAFGFRDWGRGGPPEGTDPALGGGLCGIFQKDLDLPTPRISSSLTATTQGQAILDLNICTSGFSVNAGIFKPLNFTYIYTEILGVYNKGMGKAI